MKMKQILTLLCTLPYVSFAFIDTANCQLQQKNMTTCFQESLSSVLIKQSGHNAILKHPTIKKALQNAEQYVHTYKMISDESIEISYQSNTVHELIKETPFPVWTGKRPSTMVWLIDQQTSSTLPYSELSKNIMMYAKKRGIRIMFPMDDLETESLIENMSPQTHHKLWSASQRYHVDNALIGIINHQENSYNIAWKLLNNKRDLNWQQSDPVLQHNIDRAIDHTVEQYASETFEIPKYTYPKNKTTIEFSNIQDYDDLMQLLKLLKNNQNIRKTHLLAIKKDHIFVEITTQSSESNIENILSRIPQIAKADLSPYFSSNNHYSLINYAT